jgi:hypothetical protein
MKSAWTLSAQVTINAKGETGMKEYKKPDLAAERAAREAAEARIKQLEFEAQRKDELLMQMNVDMADFMQYTEERLSALEGGTA